MGFGREKRRVARRCWVSDFFIMAASISHASVRRYYPNGLDHMVNCPPPAGERILIKVNEVKSGRRSTLVHPINTDSLDNRFRREWGEVFDELQSVQNGFQFNCFARFGGRDGWGE